MDTILNSGSEAERLVFEAIKEIEKNQVVHRFAREYPRQFPVAYGRVCE
jgi:hypothetical protein